MSSVYTTLENREWPESGIYFKIFEKKPTIFNEPPVIEKRPKFDDVGACVSGVRADLWKSEGAPTSSNKALLRLLVIRGRNERTGSCDFCLLSAKYSYFLYGLLAYFLLFRLLSKDLILGLC